MSIGSLAIWEKLSKFMHVHIWRNPAIFDIAIFENRLTIREQYKGIENVLNLF